MNPAFLLGTAFNIAYWHRKYHSGTICKGVSNPQASNAFTKRKCGKMKKGTTGSYQRLDLFIKVLWLFCPNVTDSTDYKKRSPKNAELVLSCNNGGFPRYVLNQLKIFVPVGKDIKIVTPVK